MSDIFLAGQITTAGQLNTFIQSGSVLVPFDNETAANEDISFPVPFAEPPHVTAMVVHGTITGAAAVYSIRGANLTASGLTIRVRRDDSTTPITADLEVHWIAHGRYPGGTP